MGITTAEQNEVFVEYRSLSYNYTYIWAHELAAVKVSTYMSNSLNKLFYNLCSILWGNKTEDLI